MLFGDVSKSSITVDPVVVIPDILSKKDSLKERFKLESKKGILPKRAILIHASDEKRNACFKFNCFSLVKLVRTVKIPITIVIIADGKKTTALFVVYKLYSIRRQHKYA